MRSDSIAELYKAIMKTSQVFNQVTTNVLTHVAGATVAAGMRGIVYGVAMSNWSGTTCTVAITEGGTVAMGPFQILGNDFLQLPVGGNPGFGPVGVFRQGRDIRARVSTAGTNVAINIYYFAQPV